MGFLGLKKKKNYERVDEQQQPGTAKGSLCFRFQGGPEGWSLSGAPENVPRLQVAHLLM